MVRCRPRTIPLRDGRTYPLPGTILSVSAVTDAAGISDVFAVTTTGNSLWERTASGWVDLSDGYFQQISATTDAAGNAVVFGVLGSGAGAYADSLWEYHNGAWSELAGYGLSFPGGVQYVSTVHRRGRGRLRHRVVRRRAV